MKNLIPVNDNILVLPEEAETETEHGLHIPDGTEKSPLIKGKVIQTSVTCKSPEGMTILAPCMATDTILFHRHSGHEIEEGDIKYRLIKFDHVFATINS